MSEGAKTGIFAAAAVVSAILAFAFRGSVGESTVPEEVGAKMFTDFKDPLQAKSLKITRFNETLAELNEIEVKELDETWVLPSHQNYPVDAENRVRDATTPFADMEIIRVVSDSESDHTMFGVVEPSKEKSEVGDAGVGIRVAIKDSGGKSLADVVIGKAVKDQEGQRYVRRTGQSRVYVAKIDPENLPTDFEDWIEEDLLKVSSFDVDELVLKDYTVDLSDRRSPLQQRMVVNLTEESSKWKLDEMLLAEGDKKELVESKLLSTEELNEERIDGLRDALAEIKIVSVRRKPKGLTADLQTDKGFFNDDEGLQSLAELGFYPVQTRENPDGELLSSEGEVLATTKDGVQYVLRFGNEAKGEELAANRYLLVTAKVNYDRFPEPELEPLPELPEKEKAELPEAENATPDGDTSPAADDPPSGENATEDGCGPQEEEAQDESDAGDANGETNDENQSDKESTDEEAETANDEAKVADETTNDEAKVADETTNDEAKVADETTNESEKNNVQADDEAAKDTSNASDDSKVETTEETAGKDDVDDSDNSQVNATESAAEEKDEEKDIYAEHERISKENKRKEDEHREKIEKAEEEVRELNFRFADWYYIISDDVYKKIHLGRSDIIKVTEEAKKEGFGVDAFNQLEGGLENAAGDQEE